MVKLEAITEANARFAADNVKNEGLVCVFTGATSGTGAGAIEKMATMLQKATFYVVGRSAERFAAQRSKLEGLNPSLRIVFLEAQVSLISDIDAVSEKIKAAEKKIDYLYMSQGCFPINVAQYTKEGIDLCFAIQFYGRTRLVANLLPLLRKAPHPRVLSVLNGGREEPMVDSDLGLTDPKNYYWKTVVSHINTMTTLSLEHLASENPEITFIHSFPGLVPTEIFTRLTVPEDSGIPGKLLAAFVNRFAPWLQWLVGISVEECGARLAFLLTTDQFGPGELWRINQNSEVVTKAGVLERYRAEGWREKVWEHTLSMFEKALTATN